MGRKVVVVGGAISSSVTFNINLIIDSFETAKHTSDKVKDVDSCAHAVVSAIKGSKSEEFIDTDVAKSVGVTVSIDDGRFAENIKHPSDVTKKVLKSGTITAVYREDPPSVDGGKTNEGEALEKSGAKGTFVGVEDRGIVRETVSVVVSDEFTYTRYASIKISAVSTCDVKRRGAKAIVEIVLYHALSMDRESPRGDVDHRTNLFSRI